MTRTITVEITRRHVIFAVAVLAAVFNFGATVFFVHRLKVDEAQIEGLRQRVEALQHNAADDRGKLEQANGATSSWKAQIETTVAAMDAAHSWLAKKIRDREKVAPVEAPVEQPFILGPPLPKVLPVPG